MSTINHCDHKYLYNQQLCQRAEVIPVLTVLSDSNPTVKLHCLRSARPPIITMCQSHGNSDFYEMIIIWYQKSVNPRKLQMQRMRHNRYRLLINNLVYQNTYNSKYNPLQPPSLAQPRRRCQPKITSLGPGNLPNETIPHQCCPINQSISLNFYHLAHA